MTKQLYLYSTSHCHLCELAYAFVVQLPDIALEVIEIADNEALLAQYGLRIPVLQMQNTKAELDWPFSEVDLREFLK